jgi:pimeloyl-ACP methyl ester carboxylesterase
MRRALDYYHFPDLETQLGRIRCPVIVGWGTHDRVVPYSDAAFFMAHLPDARLVSWSGCGHVPMMERRAECDALLREVWAAGQRTG